nr:MAG TPA_asm: Protein of unknown function (DUF3039) [Caudoviricetes sp.]
MVLFMCVSYWLGFVNLPRHIYGDGSPRALCGGFFLCGEQFAFLHFCAVCEEVHEVICVFDADSPDWFYCVGGDVGGIEVSGLDVVSDEALGQFIHLGHRCDAHVALFWHFVSYWLGLVLLGGSLCNTLNVTVRNTVTQLLSFPCCVSP